LIRSVLCAMVTRAYNISDRC